MGTRMQSAIPKQFLVLKGKPVLFYSINTFLEALPSCTVVLVLPESHLDMGRDMVNNYFPGAGIRVVTGGHTRFHSVHNGLKEITGDGIVFVHDAVRCLVSSTLIRRCYDAAIEYGSAIPVVDAKDSIRIVDGAGNHAIDRSSVKLVQTPQAFKTDILLPAFREGYRESFTDEATVVEASGLPVHLVQGEDSNIKITTPVDLETAEKLLAGKQS